MIVRVGALPDCNYCRHPSGGLKTVPALYDFKTLTGEWAFGCRKHYLQHRMYYKLGLGMGQRLVLEE